MKQNNLKELFAFDIRKKNRTFFKKFMFFWRKSTWIFWWKKTLKENILKLFLKIRKLFIHLFYFSYMKTKQ